MEGEASTSHRQAIQSQMLLETIASAMMESGAEPSLSSKLTKLMFFLLKTGHSFIVQWEENSLVSKLDKFVTDDKD